MRSDEIPSSWFSSDQREEVNCFPWSVVTSAGTPKREIQCRKRAVAHVEAVMSESGTASSHREDLSMIVIRYEQPSEGGSGPTRSTCREVKRVSGTGLWTSGECTCRVTFEAVQ